MSNKELLRQAILAVLNHNLTTAMHAADTAKDTATSKESIAENKYDTFGLEASYLAHGQSQRALALQDSIYRFRHLTFKDFTEDDVIDLTCLVTLSDSDTEKLFFMGPVGGGLKVEWMGREVTVITPETPLGVQLMGKAIDDTVELTLSQKKTLFEIADIC